MPRRLRVVLPCALLLILLAGHTALWLAATAHLRNSFDTWVVQRRLAGWQVDSGKAIRGGWPLEARLTIPDIAVAAGPAGATGRIAWHAARVVLHLTASQPTILAADVEGMQTLRIDPGRAQAFSATRTHIEVPLTPPAAGPGGSLEVRDLRGDQGSVGLLTAQLTLGADPMLSLTAEAIALPPGEWPFGPRVSSVALDATVHGGLPPPGPLAASAAAWRDAGGRLDVTHLALGWGPLGLSATARLALDDALQPAGSADLRVVGYAKSLEALAAHQVISSDAALAATAVLTLLAHVPPDGGAPEVDAALTLRGGKLLLGHTPLLNLPPIAWPR